MKNRSTLFLKVVIALIAIVVATGMIWFPQTEGRARDLDLVSIYMDPLIIYIYLGSTPFFLGLYQAFKLLNLIDANKAFSKDAVKALRTIKFAALSLIGFIMLALVFIRFFAHGDDPAGPTGLGILVSLASGVVAAVSDIFANLLEKKFKSRN